MVAEGCTAAAIFEMGNIALLIVSGIELPMWGKLLANAGNSCPAFFILRAYLPMLLRRLAGDGKSAVSAPCTALAPAIHAMPCRSFGWDDVRDAPRSSVSRTPCLGLRFFRCKPCEAPAKSC